MSHNAALDLATRAAFDVESDQRCTQRGWCHLALRQLAGISILLSILDAITALGSVRDWLPVHYAFTWFDALSTTIDWSEMIRGASYSAITGILFYALAINKFAKKDITS
jgi:hypothetical protein